MPSLADHFADMLKDAAFHRSSLDFDLRRDLFSLVGTVANDPTAKLINVAEGDSTEAIFKKIQDVRAQGKDLRAIDQLAQALGISEMPGFGSYEEGDPRWIESLINYYKYRSKRANFPAPTPPFTGVTPLIDQSEIKIGIVGDWGTGEKIAKDVIAAMQSHTPDYAIHLGDVYYSGAVDEESLKFIPNWPFTNGRSYTLNSNHEMYSGGLGYFGKLLTDPKFAAHKGSGYFALTNDQWLIIGLDTAYFSQSFLYQEGAIYETDLTDPQARGMVQVNWLKQTLQAHPNKRVILMTHHDGFSIEPSSGKVTRKPLYQQISNLMQSVKDWWWYWGHVHTAIAYRRIFFANNTAVTPRCVGHGAIPYMPFAPDLSRLGGGDVAVTWAETDLARDPANPLRAPNGFLLVTLTGGDLKEEFYDERNRLRWSNY
jgi:hypothetical protein